MKIFEITKTIKDEIQHFVDQVKSDCQPYLANKGNRDQLYRGMSNKDPILLHQTIQKSRNTYSAPEIADEFTQLLLDSGFKATRLNCVFALGKPQVELFGDAYLVFPVGEYEMTWFDTKTFDGVFDLGGNAIKAYGQEILAREKKLNTLPSNPKEANRVAVRAFWAAYKDSFHHGNQTFTRAAIRSGSEVMIHGSAYHAIKQDIFIKYKLNAKLYG